MPPEILIDLPLLNAVALVTTSASLTSTLMSHVFLILILPSKLTNLASGPASITSTLTFFSKEASTDPLLHLSTEDLTPPIVALNSPPFNSAKIVSSPFASFTLLLFS